MKINKRAKNELISVTSYLIFVVLEIFKINHI
ncbi:MAG: hypothetical protein PWQ14_852 [Rikenellaceae bacterium]|jgi:hypothetical protein|nr:hypothetical protein [Rikenellaceae bacterium]